jgi:hypothetical protein
MNTYALRCIEGDYPELLSNAATLGVIRLVDGHPEMIGGGEWDFIGYKRVGEQPPEGTPDTRPYLEDAQGNKYVHVNARTPVDIRTRAQELAASNPAIAAGLANLGRFFITDNNGQYAWPNKPIRVFA